MSGTTVLLVDGDVDSRLIYAAMLESAGYSVLTARSGTEALAILAEQTPSVVVTELMVPIVSGFELLHRMKHHHATLDIPVVFVTTEARAEVRQKAEEAGCTVYLTKPCPPRDLLCAVDGLLYDHKYAISSGA